MNNLIVNENNHILSLYKLVESVDDFFWGKCILPWCRQMMYVYCNCHQRRLINQTLVFISNPASLWVSFVFFMLLFVRIHGFFVRNGYLLIFTKEPRIMCGVYMVERLKETNLPITLLSRQSWIWGLKRWGVVWLWFIGFSQLKLSRTVAERRNLCARASENHTIIVATVWRWTSNEKKSVICKSSVSRN